jgi:hypothetical protein
VGLVSGAWVCAGELGAWCLSVCRVLQVHLLPCVAAGLGVLSALAVLGVSSVCGVLGVSGVLGVFGVAGVPGSCLCVSAQLQCLALVEVSLVFGVCVAESVQ